MIQALASVVVPGRVLLRRRVGPLVRGKAASIFNRPRRRPRPRTGVTPAPESEDEHEQKEREQEHEQERDWEHGFKAAQERA